MRSMFFSQILGQERAKRFLKQVMAREKMPHAYLFTGIPGIGKTSTATALAMSLNCHHPIDGDGCGKCPSCRLMIAGNSPDLLFIKPDGQNIKIDQIRDLNHSLSFAPLSLRYRVCIIYQAETMTAEAANSFLKTLEEPPSGNILILNIIEPLNLLPTIVSRCQRVPFKPLALEEIMNWLVREKGLHGETAQVVAKVSAGSLGRAKKMCEGDFMKKRDEWLSRLLRLGGITSHEAIDMALECAGEDKKVNIDLSDNSKAGIMDMLFVWETWYRDLLVVSAQAPDHLIINVDFLPKLQKSAESYNIKKLTQSLLAISQARRDLRGNRNPALVMEHSILNLRGLAQYLNGYKTEDMRSQ